MTPFVIERIFGPVRDQLLKMQTDGRLGFVYMAHADPSVSGANFGFAIGHLEQVEDEPNPHVFFDVLHYWDPRDFDNGIVDYPEIERQFLTYIQAFGISRLTFDQFNSANSIQRLQRDANSLHLPKRCQVFKVDATAATNWNKAEIFKTAASLGLVHAPPHAHSRLEREHLERINNRVDHPKTGDVRT
jgi:hypothetical protein